MQLLDTGSQIIASDNNSVVKLYLWRGVWDLERCLKVITPKRQSNRHPGYFSWEKRGKVEKWPYVTRRSLQRQRKNSKNRQPKSKHSADMTAIFEIFKIVFCFYLCFINIAICIGSRRYLFRSHFKKHRERNIKRHPVARRLSRHVANKARFRQRKKLLATHSRSLLYFL